MLRDPRREAMVKELRESLRESILERAFMFGDFTLASGKKSKYYVDARQLFKGDLMASVAHAFHETAMGLVFHAVGGLEVGAVPLTSAFLVYDMVMSTYRKNYEGFYVRKQPKDHGTGKLIEGRLYADQSVLILDDVLTTGESAMKAIRAVEAVGAKVAGVVCLIDRLQGARELLKGYDFRPVYTVRDFGIEPEVACPAS